MNPYFYFDCEISAYRRLAAEMAGKIPAVMQSVSITPEQEAELLKSQMRFYQPAKYRRKVGKSGKELPLKGLLMEYVEGERLSREVLSSSRDMQQELLAAVDKMHSCGIFWGDVKWRNIIVRDRVVQSSSADLQLLEDDTKQTTASREAVVILDFSNARVASKETEVCSEKDRALGILTRQDWENRRQQELRIVHNMIRYGRLTDSHNEI